ncbi:hypothetical protein [Victivallis vadensis]|uniref:hypothetical protein n=1 Tax=Victivallis vadensis TaxID=172901 RepID=UPI0023EF5FE2|nr:hypothetical protein [Victivallis vadensis]
MDKIKLELLRDMEGYIPPLIPVTEDDKSIIISRIFPELHVKDEITICRQVDSWDSIAPIYSIDYENDEDLRFNFHQLLLKEKLSICDYVYISYDSFMEIDKVSLSEFCKKFIYYWYPVADDVEIVADDFSWKMLLRHDGCIFLHRT